MQAIVDSLDDPSVGAAEIDRGLHHCITVAQHHLQEPWSWMRRSRNSWLAGGTTEPPATAPLRRTNGRITTWWPSAHQGGCAIAAP